MATAAYNAYYDSYGPPVQYSKDNDAKYCMPAHHWFSEWKDALIIAQFVVITFLLYKVLYP